MNNVLCFLLFHWFETSFSSNTTIFNGSDVFPAGHSCSMCCFKEYKYLNINDTMNACDILSSTEGTSFLLLNSDGALEIYKNVILIWSSMTSCDESKHKKQCHQTSNNAQLYLDSETGILTLFDTKLLWKKGYSNSNIDTLQINDDGHILLTTPELNTIWTSDTQFDSEGYWKLVLSHNCTQGAYFTPDTARQIGTESDLMFSDLIKLSELKYQKDDSYLFKMRWPQNDDILDLVWKQSTNPSADSAVSGFESLMDPYQRITWSGLALSSETYANKSLINGDNSGQWGLPIAVYANYSEDTARGCLYGPNLEYPSVNMVQLWVREYKEIASNAGQSFLTENEDKTQVKGELMIVGYPDEPVIESNDTNDWPVIAIQRIMGKTGEIEAFCVTQDGTAVHDEDFVYTKKEFKWLDQEIITQTMQIPIIDDDIFEFDEYFTVHCDSLSSDVPISRNDIKITIQGPNDIIDGTALILRESDVIFVNESVQHLTLQVEPTFHENNLTVRYTTHSINAQCSELDDIEEEDFDDIDYINVTGVFNWAPKEMKINNITIQIMNDSVWEIDKCFSVILYDNEYIEVYDNVTVCIRDDDDPHNCSDTHWSQWTECNTEYGIGQQIRYKHIGIPDVLGTIHCETQIETQTCSGNMSYLLDPDIILSTHSVNLSENGSMFNLPQMSEITLRITTSPIVNETHSNNMRFMESDSLIEIALETNPDIINFIDFEPAYISFNDLDWSTDKKMTFTAIDDDAFTATEIVIEIQFKIRSLDWRYHNISVEPLEIHIWDDDVIEFEIVELDDNENKMDLRMITAIVCVVLAFICLCLSYLRGRYNKYMEWQLHHELHFDQLIQEESEYSDFSEMNLDDTDYLR